MGASKTLKQAYGRQQDLTSTAQNLGQQQVGSANQQFGQRADLLKKPTEFYSGLASGDRTKMVTAAAPGLANISGAANSTRGAIQDTVPAGAARQFALAQLERDKWSKGADFLNQAYMQSFPALQGLASDQGNFGLQQLGAGMRGYEAAGQGNQNIIQSESQRQQAKMNMIGSIAGMAGTATGGWLNGRKKA